MTVPRPAKTTTAAVPTATVTVPGLVINTTVMALGLITSTKVVPPIVIISPTTMLITSTRDDVKDVRYYEHGARIGDDFKSSTTMC